MYEFSSGQGYWAVLKFFPQSSVYKAFLLYKSSISDNACTSLKAVLPFGSCERNYASKLFHSVSDLGKLSESLFISTTVGL